MGFSPEVLTDLLCEMPLKYSEKLLRKKIEKEDLTKDFIAV
jgi:hypothetical protein